MWKLASFITALLVFRAASQAKPTIFIDLGLQIAAPAQQVQLSLQVCIGLANRNDEIIGPAYGLKGIDDIAWLKATGSGTGTEKRTLPVQFLKQCLNHVAAGWMRYNYTEQKIIIPNIVTLAAVEDVVPLEDSQLAMLGIDPAKTPPLIDCTKLFPNIDPADTETAPREATSYVFSKYKNKTSGLSKMNPGLDVHGKHKLNPPLTGDADLGLVDYIVKERLFNFFCRMGVCLSRKTMH